MDATTLAGTLLKGAPANETVGLRVASAVDGRAEVVVDVPTHLTNVIGSMHASGLIALIDASGIAAIISAMPDADAVRGLLPLGRAGQLEFLAPARGSLTARCELGAEAREQLTGLAQPGARARLWTETTIVGDGGEVCTGRFEWSVRYTE